MTDLLEEASVEIGLKLTPLSPPEAFVDLLFQKKTDAGMYGPANSQKTFVLKVMKHTGTTADGVNTFDAKYMKVLNGRACRGEVEPFNQGELLEHLLDESGQRERLMATKAGELLERLTRYSYIKTLAFWVDLTAQGKIVSKIFQRSGLLLSDVSSGVEDAVAAIAKLKKEPGIFMKGLDKDFDATHQTLHGRELSGIADGEEAYDAMVENVTNSVVEHMNERFYTILSDPVFKAGCKFEHMRWPSFGTDRLALESHGEQRRSSCSWATTKRSTAISVATRPRRAASGGGSSSTSAARPPLSRCRTSSCTSASSTRRGTSSCTERTARARTSSTSCPSTTSSSSSRSSCRMLSTRPSASAASLS